MGGGVSKEEYEEEKRERERAEQRERDLKKEIRRKQESDQAAAERAAEQLRREQAHWRVDNLGPWDENAVKGLMRNIDKITTSLKDLTFFRIIFVGHMGSGKSTLINAFNTALSGTVDNRAVEGGRDHTTKHFLEYPAFNEDNDQMAFTFCDVRGTGAVGAGSTDVDILRAVLGQKKVGEEFVPGQRVESLDSVSIGQKSSYMIAYVLDAAAYMNKVSQGEQDLWLPQMLHLKELTDEWPVSRVLILTHLDQVEPKLLEDISKIHHSATVKKVVERVQDTTKFPMRCVFPVVNPVNYVHEIPDGFRAHLLYTLMSLVKDARDSHRQRAFNEARRDQ